MSKAVLTSINPPHTNNIFAGIKKIEWRKGPLPTGKHFCYETKKCFGQGKVIGEFRIWRVKRFENLSLIPEGYIDSGCVPFEFLEAYSKGKPIYANFILSPKLYNKPKELGEFYYPQDRFCEKGLCGDCPKYETPSYEYGEVMFDCEWKKPLTRPPQSWCYVEDNFYE